MTPETEELSRIIAGEAPASCPFMAMIAVAWIASRFQEPRKYMYGYNDNPHARAVAAALLWRYHEDPTDGAYHVVSEVDLKRADVRAFTSDRGPPVQVYECASDTLYVFE